MVNVMPHGAVELREEAMNQTFWVNRQCVKQYYVRTQVVMKRPCIWPMMSRMMLNRAATVNQALHRRQPGVR